MFLLTAASVLMMPGEKTHVPPPPPVEFREGIWSGSLGGHELRACHVGLAIQYYEMGAFRVFPLYQQTPRNVWERHGDGQAGPVESWSVTAREDGAIDVSRAIGGETVSGALKPMAASPAGGFPCSSDAFIAPKLGPLETATTLDSLGEVGFWRVVRNPGPGFPLAEMQSMELDGTKPGDATINDRLRKEASTWDGEFDHLACERRNLEANGASAVFRLHHDPVMLNQRFAAIRFRYEVQCGGPLSRGAETVVFDRTSGEPAEPARWFTAENLEFMYQGSGAAVPVPGLELATALQALGGASAKNCQFDPMVQFPARITVRSGGFGFERADLRTGDCDPVVLPWIQAAPLLNPAGKAVILDLARQTRPAKRGAAAKPLVEY